MPIKNLHNIYLIGPMGAGKTSVGKQLATLGQRMFYDADAEIEKRTGVDIAWIFTVEGEAGFRKREAAIIAELTQLDHIVLSTGGGAVIREDNRERLMKNGIVVYLQVSIEIQVERVSRRKESRPLFVANTTQTQLTALNQTRVTFYNSMADLTYSTDNFAPHTIAARILADISQLAETNT